MGAAIGFIIGYILGTRSAPLDLDEISRAWDDIKSSEETQALVSGGADMALQVFRQGLGVLGQVSLKK